MVRGDYSTQKIQSVTELVLKDINQAAAIGTDVFFELEGLEKKPATKVRYYNMVKQGDGSYKAKLHHTHSELVIKSNNAIFRSHWGVEYDIAPALYMDQTSSHIGVYTYWNSDKSIKKQVVLSSNDVIEGFILEPLVEKKKTGKTTMS